MKRTINKENCCGCAACQSICSQQAISMIPDEEGFLYPNIDEGKCVNCGLCYKICSFANNQLIRGDKDEELDKSRMVYVGRHKNPDVVYESRSGGAFTAISDVILGEGGYVFGVITNENMEVIYSCAVDIKERNRMRGSKYVQSYIDKKLYEDILIGISSGKKILFVGTSCQVEAVKKLFEGNERNIIYMDIVCHGVVSPLVYKKYIDYLEKKNNSKVVDVDFRNKKKYGWKDHIETIYFRDRSIDSGTYRNIFYSCLATRPSCSKCPYKTQNHPGDITIADCWGIEQIAPEYADNKGCSLIFINNEKGKEIFNMAKGNMNIRCVSMSEALFQQPLHKAYTVNLEKRQVFWKNFIENSELVFEKYKDDTIL